MPAGGVPPGTSLDRAPTIAGVSILASPADLPGQLSAYGGSGLLVTVNDDGRPHVVAVSVEQDAAGAALSASVGSTTRANAAARPGVTLLFAPGTGGEYTLVVDGDAVASDGESVTIRPTSALLHRVAGATGDRPRCYRVDVPG
jgi:hypothetical protein